jgi:nitrilase
VPERLLRRTLIDYKRPIFKAAAVQAAPVLRDKPIYLDLHATLEKACDLIIKAGENDAKLVVFPEGFLPSFPYWSIDVDEPQDWKILWKEFVNNSVEVPSPDTDAICQAAKEANAYVVMGINERDKNYGCRIYNAALFVSPFEGVLGVHRKINPTLGELLYHTRGDGGDNIKVFKTDLGNIGSLICGEHTQLPLVYNMIVQAEQINCSLWPGSRKRGINTELQTIMTRAICISGAMFAVCACCCIPEGLIPKKSYPNACLERIGGSCIIDPMGEYIAGPVYDIETIVYGEIDLGAIPLSKSVHNLTGIYSRWDLFSLAVRQKPYQPIVPLENDETVNNERDLQIAEHLEERVIALEQQIKAIYEQLNR